MKFLVILITCIPVLLSANTGPFWGKTGHRTTAEVASRYLCPTARAQVNELLQGRSMALVSNFADDIKSDERYRALDPWHYVNFPLGKDYNDQKASSRGDIVQAISTCIEVLKNPEADRDEKEFHLKLLIHFIGDLHQPLHIGRAEDKGGNDIQVRWFSRGSNLHRVWDTQMIGEFGMSFSELSRNLPVVNEEQVREIASGDYYDWMRETRQETIKVYGSVRVGEKLGYRYMYDHFDTVRWQLLKGGIRLAALLNEIFE